MALVSRTLIEWILGSLLLGVVLAITAFVIIYFVFRLMSLKAPRETGSKLGM
jgi:uncharacterized PurR-regulated membrane protein YhhQ (DUF165 family)